MPIYGCLFTSHSVQRIRFHSKVSGFLFVTGLFCWRGRESYWKDLNHFLVLLSMNGNSLVPLLDVSTACYISFWLLYLLQLNELLRYFSYNISSSMYCMLWKSQSSLQKMPTIQVSNVAFYLINLLYSSYADGLNVSFAAMERQQETSWSHWWE